MGKIEEYIDRAKDIAGDAGDVAKNIAGDVVSRAKELTDEGRKVRELTQNARGHAADLTFGAREKIQSALQDARAVKELRQGIAELEAVPEYEGSILYNMELGTVINELKSLSLLINDNRLDDASVEEEIRKVMAKIQPAPGPLPEETETQKTDEERAIENVKNIAFAACTRALDTLGAAQ